MNINPPLTDEELRSIQHWTAMVSAEAVAQHAGLDQNSLELLTRLRLTGMVMAVRQIRSAEATRKDAEWSSRYDQTVHHLQQQIQALHKQLMNQHKI